MSLPSNDVNIENFIKIINKCSSYFTRSNIVLTGGEPTLNGTFFEMLSYASSRMHTVTITSNGSFSKETCDKLKEYLDKGNIFLQLSLDGSQSSHDSIRGKGSFNSVIQNLAELQDYSNKVVISTTVTKDSTKGVLELAQILNSFRFIHWKVSSAQLSSPEEILNGFNSLEWNGFVDALLPLCQFRVHIKKLFDFELFERHLKSKSERKPIYNCGFGINKFYISPDFYVYPCSCVDEYVGNILIEDVKDLYERLLKISKIIPQKGSLCENCEYWEICHGGCPGYSMKCYGSYNHGDIRCPKIRLQYEKSSYFNH